MATIRTDHDMTRMLQGIAIIFMIIHHLPISGIDGGEPLVTSILGRYFVSNMKICVGIYTFLIGFGYYFTSKKNYHTARLRIMRFLKRWWGLFFIIFLPIGLILDSYTPDGLSLLYNAFGLREDLNWYSWFVYVYLYSMMVMPLVAKIIERRPLIGTAALIVICFAIEVVIHMIPNWDNNELLHAIFSTMLYSPILIVGYTVCKLNLFGKLSAIIHHNVVFIGLFIFIIAIACRALCANIMGFNLDTIYAPVVCFGLMLALSTLTSASITQKILCQLGKLSIYMWFLHSLFFCSATNAWFIPIIKNTQSIFVVFAIVFMLTWMIAAFLSYLEKKITNQLSCRVITRFKGIVRLAKS